MSTNEAPERWRMRSEDVRSLAKNMQDADARRVMLRIAREYEDLASLRIPGSESAQHAAPKAT